MIWMQTPRLILRDWQEEDFPHFCAMNADPEVMRYFKSVLSESESLDLLNRIKEEISQSGYGLWAVEEKSSGEWAGFIGLHLIVFESSFTPCVEIGWRLKKSAQGRGLATEGAREVLDFARDKLALQGVYSFTSILNRPSENVMKKLGMEKIDEFDHPLIPEGHELRRHVLYFTGFSGQNS